MTTLTSEQAQQHIVRAKDLLDKAQYYAGASAIPVPTVVACLCSEASKIVMLVASTQEGFDKPN
jgi:hypothetical protein